MVNTKTELALFWQSSEMGELNATAAPKLYAPGLKVPALGAAESEDDAAATTVL